MMRRFALASLLTLEFAAGALAQAPPPPPGAPRPPGWRHHWHHDWDHRWHHRHHHHWWRPPWDGAPPPS